MSLLGYIPEGRNLQMDVISNIVPVHTAVLFLFRFKKINPKEQKKTLWRKINGLWDYVQTRKIRIFSYTAKSKKFFKSRWVTFTSFLVGVDRGLNKLGSNVKIE